MKFTVSAGEGLPVGSYAAEFSGAEPVTNDFGEGVKLIFKCLQGDHAGQQATRICSTKLSPKSNLFRFLTALKGGEKLEPGEQIDIEALIGTRGMMIVEATDSGSSRVGSFIRMT